MCTVVLLTAMPRATPPSRGRRAETPCPSIARCRSTTQISPPSSPRVRGDKTRRSFQRDDEIRYADHEAGPESVRSQVRNALTSMTTVTPVIRLSGTASFASHLDASSGCARLRPLEVGQRVDRLLRRSARRISRGDRPGDARQLHRDLRRDSRLRPGADRERRRPHRECPLPAQPREQPPMAG
jgi:hypothetical protein